MNMKRFNIYLLRHGEITDKDSLAGHTDFNVTELGREQMISSAADLEFELCMSSPLKRCRKTAEQIAQQKGVSLLVEAGLKEMNFGDWDGLPYEQLWQLPTPNIGDFWQTPYQHTPPNGESFSDFVGRVKLWWHAFVDQVDQNTLVVTHAGVIKCLLALLLSDENKPKQIEKIATTVSIQYGGIVQLSCFKEENRPAHVQVRL